MLEVQRIIQFGNRNINQFATTPTPTATILKCTVISGRIDVLEQQPCMSKRDRLIREGMLIEQHGVTLNTQKAGAYIIDGSAESKRRANRNSYRKNNEKIKQRRNENREKTSEYNRQRSDTDNICAKCGRHYRGIAHKSTHQRSQRCQRLAQQRIQPVINIDGDNNNVTINITVTV